MKRSLTGELKKMENYKTVTPKSRRGRLQEVVFYEKFQLQGFDWENFFVLDLWTRMEGGHLRKVVADGGSTVSKFPRVSWADFKNITKKLDTYQSSLL